MSVMPSISLVNVSNNQKHSINSTECVIGRGWLQCDDKRISRNHGILKVISPNSVAVISTHQNSMFFRKKNDTEVCQIEENGEVNLFVGDSFGLLVDAFWFSIQETNGENDLTNQSNAIQSISIASSSNGIKRKPSSDSQPDSTNKKVKTEPDEFQDDDDVEAIIDFNTTDRVANEPSTSTSVSNDIPPTQMQNANTATMAIKAEPMDPDSMAIVVKTEPASNDETVDSTNAPVPKPIKTEVKEEPSNHNDEATTSGGNAERTHRDCCRYGMRCYRRNPTHRAQEAHPGDADYRMPDYPDPPLGAAPCPYLDRCYRRNPQHFRQFSHKTPLGKEGYEATARVPASGSTTQTDDDDDDDDVFDGDTDEEDA